MSVPADQLPQGQPQVFTEQDFANAENPPAGAPTPGSFDESEFGPDPNEKPVPTPPSLLDRAGSAIKSGYHDLVGGNAAKASALAAKPSSTKGPKQTEPLNPDAALEARIHDALHSGGAVSASDGAQFYRDLATKPGILLRALGHGSQLSMEKTARDLGFSGQPYSMVGNPMFSPDAVIPTPNEPKEAKERIEAQQQALAKIGKTHPVTAQVGQALPETILNLGAAIGGGEAIPEELFGEAAAKYPAFVKAVQNPVVGRVLRRLYEVAKGAPRGALTVAAPSALEGTDTYHEVLDNGGTVAQGIESGAAVGVSNMLLGSVAPGMRGGLAARLAKGTIYGVGSSIAQTAITNPFLPANMQQKNTVVGMGVNGLMMGALAGIFGTRDLSPEAVNELYDNVQDTAANDPDPAKRASANRILTTANQLQAASGGRSSHAIIAASHAETARQTVLDSPHADLYGKNESYTRAYDAAQGQFPDEAKRQAHAKAVAAAETASNTGWQEFMKLRRIVDDGLKDYMAAGQMPELVAHAKSTLPPDKFNDLIDFLSTGKQASSDSSVPDWMQTGLSPQYSKDVLLRTMEGGTLPAEAQQVLDARRARQLQFAKMFPGIDPETGEPIVEQSVPAHQEPESAETPQNEPSKPAPTANEKPSEPPSSSGPRQMLEDYFKANPYEHSNEVLGYAGVIPQNIQQPMADWATSHSPMEVEAAYRDAATTGQLPAEVAIHETEGRTESAETAAEQSETGLRGTQAEAQPEAQEGVAGNGGGQPTGHEGSQAATGEPEHVSGNAEGTEGNGPAEAVTPRAASPQTALADAGVAPEEATVGPKGDIRIAQDASPEAAQKALDVAASDTGATNTEYPEPTPEQAKAGNYRKGGVTFKSDEGDIRVKIENPDGSIRSGDWGSRPLKGVHYGYFPDTVSADGQPLDVLMTHDAHDPTRPLAFIRQHDTTTGKFDELKVVMGARSRNEALQAYWKQYPRNLHLKLTPNGSQDVVMMRRPKALAFIKSGNVDVPPHPVSGKPMLMLRQTVPVEFDSRSGNMSGTRDVLDKLGKKHDLKGLEEDSGVYRGEVPRSAVPDLQHALEKNNVELEIQRPASRRPAVAGRVQAKARDNTVARAGRSEGGGRRAQKAPKRRSVPPEGIPFIRSSAPIFEEGVGGRIGPHPVSVVGIHYSPKEGLTELDPAEAGTGSAGAERRRFGMGNFGRSGDPMARVMSFYVKDSAAIPAKESVVSGSNKYEAVLNNLYDSGADPDGIIEHAEREGYGANGDRILEEIRDSGYDGTVSRAPGPGQHARVATVRGIDGKIPVKELSRQYAGRTTEEMAAKVERKRDVLEEPAKEGTKEIKKKLRVPMFMLRDAEQSRLARVYFEMAPSPDFHSAYRKFDTLTLRAKKVASEKLNDAIGPDNVRPDMFGKHDKTVSGWGGYLGKINPSYSIDYHGSLDDALKHAQDIADDYNQQSVLVTSDDLPDKAPAVDIHFEGADDPKVLQKLWTDLRAKTDNEVVGFARIDGGIRILNTNAKPEEAEPWFDKIAKALTDISDKNGVKYTTDEATVGYKFVGGDYDRYAKSLLSGKDVDEAEYAHSALQLYSYDAQRAATTEGAQLDRNSAKARGFLVGGEAGVQVRAAERRAVARGTRGKPSLDDVLGGRRQLAQVARVSSAELRAHDERGEPLPAPNGKPTKLTREQWLTVRTPNFLRWGGDWLHDPKNADVLLDKETGEPKVFYHEVDPRNEAPILIQGFRTDLPLSRFNDFQVPTGTFFKETPSEIGVGLLRNFKTQLPMYLRMRKPLVVADKDELVKKLGPDVMQEQAKYDATIAEKQALATEAEQYAERHPNNRLIQKAAAQRMIRLEESLEPMSMESQRHIRAEMEAQGYDGAIISKDEGANGKTVKTYITLRPEDSKSAGLTAGTFSERPGAMYRKEPFPDTGKRVADVKAAATQLVDQFHDKPGLVVHENRASATPEAKAALDDVLGPDTTPPPAMYLDGKLHVFADQIHSPAELEQAAMHEMVHYGLRRVFGPAMDPLLDDIWNHATNDEAFKQTLKTYGKAYQGRPDFQRNIAEEYVAHLAETQSNPSAWQKVVDWFRAWGRKHGLVHDWTDDDIRHLIRSVYSDLKDSRTSIAGVPAARTTVDFQNSRNVTAYRGAAHGDFIQNMDGEWRFKNKDIDADLSRSLVDGQPALNADPKEFSAQGIRDLAALAGEERAVLTLPDYVPKHVVELSGIPYSTHDGMHVLRPEESTSPMYALRNNAEADPDTQAIIDQKIGYEHAPTSPWEWMQSHIRNFHMRNLLHDAKSYWLDAGSYIDLLERKQNHGMLYDAVTSAYKMYWLTRNVRQIAMAVIRHGAPMWTPKGYDFRPGTKGLMEIWKPMMQTADGKNLMHLYGAYKIGVRAKRLLHEFNPDGTPKEKLLTEAEADKFIDLAKKYPQFKTAFAEEQKFLKDLQDFAVERGAMDPKTAEAWQKNAYVPFRRIIDGLDTPSDAERRGVNDKIVSKRIRGAAYALKDPNEALVDNVIRMLDHIYNNDAKRRVMALGALSGAVKRMPLNWSPARVTVADAMNAMRKAGIEVDRAGLDPEDLRKVMTIFHPVAPRDANIESTVEGGKLVYWQVNDARLLKSIHDMRAINSALTDKAIKMVGTPASWVRWGVTMSPKFMAKIMFKDLMNTWGQTGTNPTRLFNPVKVWQAAKEIYTNNKFIDQLRLNGFNGNEYYKVDDIGDYLKRFGNGNKVSVMNSVQKAYHEYRHVGWISEQLSRVGVAHHVLDRGGSMAEAAWQGQNTLNWQKHGYGTAAKILMRAVPFLNAHLQGMVRIYDGMVGRDVIANRNRAIMSFFIKSMAIAIPSMVLEAENQNNKDYQRLPDYTKDAYWNFYIGGRHYMLPKPFEWGAMAGTMPQRALRVAVGKDSGREFWKAVYDTLTNDVLMLPIPALVNEPLEQYANKDFRTGLPIETEAMQQQRPEDRFNGSTTLAAKFLAKTPGASKINASPVRIQHFVNGYFASVGLYALQMMSGIMRATGHYPAPPGPRGGSWLMEQLEAPFGGAKAATEPGNQYLSDFYDAQKIADQVAGSVRINVTRGDYGRAQELAQGNPLAFRGHHELQVISVQLGRLRKQQRIVESSPYLTAQQKRVQLDAINESQKQLLDRFEPLFRSILDGKKQLETEQ